MYPYFETPFLKSINIDRVSAYNIFGAAALFFALILIIYLIRRFRLPYIRSVLLTLPGYYSGLVFSRFLFFLSVYGKAFFQNNTIYSVFKKIFLSPLEGSQVFYGGVLGSLLGILILGFRFLPRREILRVLDITIMALFYLSLQQEDWVASFRVAAMEFLRSFLA